jgi:hypothetical protein
VLHEWPGLPVPERLHLHLLPVPMLRNRQLRVCGLLLLAAAVAAHFYRFRVGNYPGSIGQWNGLCRSSLGQFGQLLSARLMSDCGYAADAQQAVWCTAALGLGLVAWSLRPRRRAR